MINNLVVEGKNRVYQEYFICVCVVAIVVFELILIYAVCINLFVSFVTVPFI